MFFHEIYNHLNGYAVSAAILFATIPEHGVYTIPTLIITESSESHVQYTWLYILLIFISMILYS